MTTLQNASYEELQNHIAKLESHIVKLENENNYLKEQLEWFKRHVFGKRSEKIIPRNDEQLLFDGFGELLQEPQEEEKTVEAHTRRSPKKDGKDKIALPKDLPTEEILIDLPEEQKVCPETGKPLVKIGEEVTNKLALKPGSYFIKKIIRPKYALPKGEGVSTAPLPGSLLTRCFADESFLAGLIVKKYCDHLPLYRQSEILSREGISISRQLLSKWVVRAGLALEPLYKLMKEVILKSGYIFVDETPVKMLDPGKGKTKETYVWLLAGGRSHDPPYRVYQFYEDRKHVNAEELLQGYHGYFHSDKYGAYEKLAAREDLTWCPCMAHCRRKFVEAQSGDLEFRDWFLSRIAALYKLEEAAWDQEPQERLKIRQEQEVPIIDEMIAAAKTRLIEGKILPKSKLRTALGYFCGLIPHLKNYTEDPFAHLDNNVAERAIRPLALGRKNWIFFGNESGGKAAAIIYSIVQTCRALGVNPFDYLEDVMRRLMDHPINKLHELLPDQWAKEKGILLKKETGIIIIS